MRRVVGACSTRVTVRRGNSGQISVNFNERWRWRAFHYSGAPRRALHHHWVFDVLSSGKVILAFAPASVRAALLERPLQRRTSHTVTDRAELEAQLDEARAAGFARTFEELEVGLNAIAAPVRSATGEVIADVPPRY